METKTLEHGKHMLSGTLGTFNVGDEVVDSKLEAWATGLPDKPDKVYYKVYYGDRELGTSEVSKDEDDPVFKEIDFKTPKGAEKLNVSMFEKKTIGSDKLLGTVEIPVETDAEGNYTLEKGNYKLKDIIISKKGCSKP